MARLRSIRHRLRRFAQVGPRRRALLIEAVVWLLLARLALVFVPFPRLARHLGTFVAPAEAGSLEDKSKRFHDHVRIAGDVGWAVTRAARHVPFRAVCLPQAMAARIMLRRRGVGSVLHFGAAKSPDTERKGRNNPISAHAWLDAAGVQVTGYPVAKGFAEIACFI